MKKRGNDMTELSKWKEYLKKFVKAYNTLPELSSILPSVAPLIFQFDITDQPGMNFWFLFNNDKVTWDLGQNKAKDIPTLIHQADLATIKMILAGKKDPIAATMEGTYKVDGALNQLMVCTPLLPLLEKAHNLSQK